MVTELGRALRKLRIDKDELMGDMATNLGVSPALLSAVENGRRRPTDGFAHAVATRYGLEPDEERRLDEAVVRQRGEVKINIIGRNRDDLMLIMAFARRFDSLDASAKDEIRRILAQDEGQDTFEAAH